MATEPEEDIEEAPAPVAVRARKQVTAVVKSARPDLPILLLALMAGTGAVLGPVGAIVSAASVIVAVLYVRGA